MEHKICLQCMEYLDSEGKCPNCGDNICPQTTSPYILPPGSVLANRYLVGKVLGQGGFGITYLGFDTALEIKVAIKEYFCMNQTARDNTVSNDIQWSVYISNPIDGREAFLKEARKMAKIRMVPNVAHILDTFNENETAYLIMEYIEGETLANQIKRLQKPLTWAEAMPIFMPVIESMQQVHENGLIHRDLSPDNLMINKLGKPVILDLGAAKDLDTNTGASSMVVAKSGFSPIEQYGDRGKTDLRTDIYSLCGTMYYTLTGIVPPPATDRLDNDTLDMSILSRNGVPKEVIAAITAGTSISKANRPESMKALAQMILGSDSDKAAAAAAIPVMSPKDDDQKSEKGTDDKLSNKKLIGVIIGLCAVLVLLIGGFIAVQLGNFGFTPADNQVTDDKYNDTSSEDDEDNDNTSSKSNETVFIDQEDVVMYIGDVLNIKAIVSPQNTSLNWDTANDKIAVVSNGTITALSEGTTTITVTTSGGSTAECVVTVKPIKVTAISLSETKLTLSEGGSATITASVKPENATHKDVVWESTNTNVATVSDGKITAKSAGTAVVTATSDGVFTTCIVTVKSSTVKVSSVSLSTTAVTLSTGKTTTITATVNPSNATDKTVTWKSSDTNVATVSNGKITAKSEGTATITATAGGVSATCKVTVKTSVVEVTKISLSKTKLTLSEGDSTTITATVSPSNATDKTVTWKSSDTSVATVSNGKITAKSEGTATITATAGGVSTTCKVTVKSSNIEVTGISLSKTKITLSKGESTTITAKISPSDATNKSVTWKSSNKSVATVSDGKIKAVAPGTATITATAGKFSCTCQVTVTGNGMLNNKMLRGSGYYKTKDITQITFLDTLKNAPSDAWDYSERGDRSVLAWVKGKQLYIAAEGGVIAGSNASYMFCGLSDQTMKNTFDNLKKLDLRGLNTSNVTNMSFMFYYCLELTEIEFGDFDTSKVTDMTNMFCGSEKLIKLDLRCFNTSKVTDMSCMFSFCSKLEELDVSSFNTSRVTTMRSMFDKCESLTSLDVTGFNTSKVTNMMAMFYGCSSLTELDTRGFDMSNVSDTNRVSMFTGTIWQGEEYAH